MNKNHTIMVVDDSPTQAKILLQILESEGYLTLRAADGEEALKIAEVHHPDLILSDVDMPIMNGIEMCAAIKSDDNLRTIPVILMTASESTMSFVHGIAAGAVNLLRKPYDRDQLLFLISKALK